jgi:hypothetical protein
MGSSIPLYTICMEKFRPAVGPIQPLIQWVPGALSPELKSLGHEDDHSPPSSAEVKNGGVVHQLPHTSSWHDA